VFSHLPTVAALSDFSSFPELTFKSFSQFIEQNFSAEISLSAVLVMLFTMTENPDLLSLHARQQYSLVKGENVSAINSWIKCLSRAVYTKVNSSNSKWLSESDFMKAFLKIILLAILLLNLMHLHKFLVLSNITKKAT